MSDDLTKKDPEWFLSGACGALHRLPPGPGRDNAIEFLEGCRKQLAILRQQEEEARHGKWELPCPGVQAQPLRKEKG